jgi:sugar phosphate isomerase/epimerase
MLPDLRPEEAAAELKASGYNGVEWRVTTVPETRKSEAASFWGNNYCTLEPTVADAKRAKALAEQYGLEQPGIGTYISLGDMNAVKAARDFCQTAGIKQFRIGLNNFDGGYLEHFKKAQAFIADVTRFLEGSDIKALLEIHHRTIVPSAGLMHRLISPFDPASIGVIYDPGNMAYEGFEDYRMGIELLGPYLSHVHLKNAKTQASDSGLWTFTWAPLEEGVVDFDALLSALKEVNYNDWLVLEDFSNVRPSREALNYNIQFIKDKLQKAGMQ